MKINLTALEALRRPKNLVVLESPFAPRKSLWAVEQDADLADNLAYGRSAVRDSLLRGEAPIASHLLYTQAGILNDNVPAERTLGIEAGLSWLPYAHKSVVYADRGISGGMIQGIKRAFAENVPVELRLIVKDSLTVQGVDSLPLPGGYLSKQLGCRCPSIDNHHGQRPRFVAEHCYLHGGREYADLVD